MLSTTKSRNNGGANNGGKGAKCGGNGEANSGDGIGR